MTALGAPSRSRAHASGARATRSTLLEVAALAAVAALAGLGSTCRTPPDPDGEPSSARPLSLERWETDELHCRKGDCADWYLVRLRDRGTLRVRAETTGDATPDARVALALADHRAQVLGEAQHAGGSGAATLQRRVSPGPYFVKVETPAKSAALGYRLRLDLEVPRALPPPPPEPRFRTVEGEVLEVEGRPGDRQFVLFGRGRTDGLRPGQRGRLLEGGEEIAVLEVTDVFPEGSRARLVVSPSRPITPDTVVQIDVPLRDEDR